VIGDDPQVCGISQIMRNASPDEKIAIIDNPLCHKAVIDRQYKMSFLSQLLTLAFELKWQFRGPNVIVFYKTSHPFKYHLLVKIYFFLFRLVWGGSRSLYHS